MSESFAKSVLWNPWSVIFVLASRSFDKAGRSLRIFRPASRHLRTAQVEFFQSLHLLEAARAKCRVTSGLAI